MTLVKHCRNSQSLELLIPIAEAKFRLVYKNDVLLANGTLTKLACRGSSVEDVDEMADLLARAALFLNLVAWGILGRRRRRKKVRLFLRFRPGWP
jgi:hypothetical protein